jgi:hypothetical protein
LKNNELTILVAELSSQKMSPAEQMNKPVGNKLAMAEFLV